MELKEVDTTVHVSMLWRTLKQKFRMLGEVDEKKKDLCTESKVRCEEAHPIYVTIFESPRDRPN